MEIDREVLVAYTLVFANRLDKFALQKPDGNYFAVRDGRVLTLEVVEDHLLGKHTVGMYALDETSAVKWLCLDADDSEGFAALVNLSVGLRQQQAPNYLERSRRGGHLWLFFETPLPGELARRFGKGLVEAYHLPSMELYPRQDRLLPSGSGSLVRLPLGIHQKDEHKRRFGFVTPEGELLAGSVREQMRLLAYPRRVSLAFVEEMSARVPSPKEVLPTPQFVPLSERKKSKNENEVLSTRIKASISVYDFVSQFVDLDRSAHGLCPFHDDHRMSFGVNQDNNYWNCFAGCGGGSVIDFWMKWRQLHGEDGAFVPTITELAETLNL
jgi:hypothetical protein